MPRTRVAVAPRQVKADAELARRIGERIRDARRAAGLTQQQLAGDRYTKAYVSALENGIARPSMVALTYLADRLALPTSHFLGAAQPAWTRLEVDTRLAAGEFDAAVDGYRSLLDGQLADPARAEVQRGLAEALARLDRGREAIAAASEAARIFTRLGREADAALARYWLAYGLYLAENEPEARSLLHALLEQIRSGLKVEPDLEVRVLTALAAIESRVGQPAKGLAYLEEARGLADDLDDRRRATFLFNLAIGYRDTGDMEAAIRAGTQAMALFRSAGAVFQSAKIENDVALTYLALGNVARAEELAAEARTQIEAVEDQRSLAAVIETQAQIALAAGDAHRALALATDSRRFGEQSGNRKAELAAIVSQGRARQALGEREAAAGHFAEAVEVARRTGATGSLRDVLREWAELRAAAGDHRGAYELTREALTVN